jgi:arsenite methyltransferase
VTRPHPRTHASNTPRAFTPIAMFAAARATTAPALAPSPSASHRRRLGAGTQRSPTAPTHRASRTRARAAKPSASALDTLLGATIIAPGGDAAVKDSVQKYYGETLATSSDLKTSACCTPANQIPKAVRDALREVPDEVKAKYYGCGSPTPVGIEGLRVLDLGSGSGRDCYVAARLVGETGSVLGIDMTDGQLAVARKYAEEYCTTTLGYAAPNMRFEKGTIEDLRAAGVDDASVDLIISNCVINLSPDKAAVLSEAYRVLANGGEFYFSDVYCDRRLPDALRSQEVLLGECLGGAMYIEDFKRLCVATGFTDPRVLAGHEIEVQDPELAELLGEAKFYSLTYRLFKLPPGRLETLCEDYGQFAYYNGTLEGSPNAYSLDDHHRFEKNKPMLVCGNTASMVGETWLGKHFTVVGDRDVHYGLFDCGPSPVASSASSAPAAGACC